MTTIRKALIAIAIILLGGGALSQQGGSPPQITFISFPSQIQADGSIVSGFIGFKDPDGDLAKAEFVAVQAKDFPSFTLNLNLKGVKEGSFEFEISTTTPQSVTLRVTLIDEANNRSQPKEFSFEAVGTGAILQVSPTSLNFSGEVGRTPPSQTIQITNAGSGTLSWSASADQPWIELSPPRGTAPSILTVSLKSSGLEVGNYTGNITITAPGAQGSPAVVRVTLTVRPPAPPAVLDISPRQLEFHGYEGRSNPAPQTLTLRNSGGQPLTWTAQAEARWLTLSSSHGTLQVGESAQVQVFVDLTGLSVGTLQSQITFTAPEAQNSPVIVPVTLRVEARPPAVLEVTPRQLEFRGQEGGSNPPAQTLTVRNSGEQPLTWTAEADVAWVNLNPRSGMLPEGQSVEIQVSVNLAGLSAGTREARITVTAPGAQGSPANIKVSLTVIAANRAPIIDPLTPQKTPWGSTLMVRIRASDPDAGDSVTLEAINLPKNASFPIVRGNPAVGTFTFTPEPAQARQSFTVTFLATDSRGLRDTEELNITVEIRPIQPRVMANVFLTSRPSGIAISPDNRRAYIANLNSNNVIVVDIQAAKAGEIIQVGRRPLGVAISPDGRYVYVANVNDNNLSIIDTQTNKVIKQVQVGRAPYGVSVTSDGSKIYVSNLNSNSISIIDARTLGVVGEIQVEAPSAMVISPDGRLAYVASYDVVVVDLQARRAIDTIKVKQPWEPQSPPWPWRLAITPDGRLVYATIQDPRFPNEDTVVAIDTQQRRIVAKIKTGNRPFGIAITPDGGFVLVANQDANNVAVIEIATNRVTQTIQDPLLTAQPLEVAITSDGRKALVTNGSNSVTIVELIR